MQEALEWRLCWRSSPRDHEFDVWTSIFGDITTELELQPSGKDKPVTHLTTFVNVPELIAMFRSFPEW